jgi:sec-independent protein translocase protein TatA
MSHHALLAILGMPGGSEWIIILVVALLIFGKRLPEVARNMGKGIVEFKKGVKGIEDDVEDTSEKPAPAADNRHIHAPQDQNVPHTGAEPGKPGSGTPQ